MGDQCRIGKLPFWANSTDNPISNFPTQFDMYFCIRWRPDMISVDGNTIFVGDFTVLKEIMGRMNTRT